MKLSDISEYVNEKVSSSDISLSEYVTTDSLLQNKSGRVVATNLPPSPCSLTKFEIGDVLIANIRPYLKKIWLATESGACSNDVLCLRAKNGHSSAFLYAVLMQDAFYDYVMKGTKGSKMPRGDKDQIMDFKVSASLNEAEIGSFVTNIGQAIDNLTAINRNLPKALPPSAYLVA